MAPLELSELLWEQVLLQRRFWTRLSLAIISCFVWTLLALAPASMGVFCWIAGASTLANLCGWLIAMHQLGRLQRSLPAGATSFTPASLSQQS